MSKYEKVDWDAIRIDYEYGLTQQDICIKYNISRSCISWGIKNGLFKPRTSRDSFKKSVEIGKFKKVDKECFNNYKKLCSFKFNVFDFPELFNLDLLKELGFYKPKNRGDNPKGLSRDHIYSIKEGYLNNVHPFIISHVMNCRLIKQTENSKKNTRCDISLDELKNKINKYEGFENLLINHDFDCSTLVKVESRYKHCKCGKQILKRSKTCCNCFKSPRKVENRPSREYLLDLLKVNSYVSVGKMYNVSDNTIRKWLK